MTNGGAVRSSYETLKPDGKRKQKPNIIPDASSLQYYVRSDNLKNLLALKARVIKCFEAGALATGCTV